MRTHSRFPGGTGGPANCPGRGQSIAYIFFRSMIPYQGLTVMCFARKRHRAHCSAPLAQKRNNVLIIAHLCVNISKLEAKLPMRFKSGLTKQAQTANHLWASAIRSTEISPGVPADTEYKSCIVLPTTSYYYTTSVHGYVYYYYYLGRCLGDSGQFLGCFLGDSEAVGAPGRDYC